MGHGGFALTVSCTAASASAEAPDESVEIRADTVARVGDELVFFEKDRQVYRCPFAAFDSLRITAAPLGGASDSRYGSNRWSSDQDRRLLDLYAQGDTIDELSRRLERSHLQVITRLGQLGQIPPLERDGEAWTTEEDEHVRQLTAEGKTLREVSGVLRRSPPTIQRHIASDDSTR